MNKKDFRHKYKELYPIYKELFGRVPNSSDYRVPRHIFIAALEQAIETKVPVENFIEVKKNPEDSDSLV